MSALTFKAACVQVNATDDMADNIRVASDMVRSAADQGADLVLMPENVTMMTFGAENSRKHAKSEADHPAIPAFAALAKETGVWLHGGTLAIQLDDRIANRTYMFNPQGEIVDHYDKIHMFDVDLGGGESYKESETYNPGERAVNVELPWGKLGLSICYDVRFAYLYRALAKDGAKMLTTPAAFTRTTGKAHWHVLQRARAIETGCYVFAPAQTGTHFGGRETYGHALIVNPWGEVIADAGEEPGVILADIDLAQVDDARAKVPALSHDRSFTGP